jgi:hypothetical protein
MRPLCLEKALGARLFRETQNADRELVRQCCPAFRGLRPAIKAVGINGG